MPRPVDRERHAARRAAIVEAASAQFATHGYERSTTAAICREAGISSGTFFHYFPTKLDALVAVLESGCDDVRSLLEAIELEATGIAAIARYAAALGAELGDASYPVFVAGIAGVESEPRVAAALAAETALVADFLARTVEAGRRDGDVRRDLAVADLATWTGWLLDGAAQAAALGADPGATPIADAVRTLLEPRA